LKQTHKIQERLSKLNNWIKYGILNSIIGIAVGIHLTLTAIGDGYYVFIFAAPLSIFVIGSVLWKLLIGTEKPNILKVIVIGIVTGSLSHYFTFLFLSIIMNICYWTFDGFADSLGGPPASIVSMIGGSLLFSFFSLFMYGWITVPASIISGIIMLKIKDKSVCMNEPLDIELE
jgi:hypothetical protein